jgi:hypothetical protein
LSFPISYKTTPKEEGDDKWCHCHPLLDKKKKKTMTMVLLSSFSIENIFNKRGEGKSLCSPLALLLSLVAPLAMVMARRALWK